MWTGLEQRRNHFLGLDGSFIESGPTFVVSIQAEATTHDRRICPRTRFDSLADLRHPEIHRTELPTNRTLFLGLPPSGQKPGRAWQVQTPSQSLIFPHGPCDNGNGSGTAP